jgi:hypothetical protein
MCIGPPEDCGDVYRADRRLSLCIVADRRLWLCI